MKSVIYKAMFNKVVIFLVALISAASFVLNSYSKEFYTEKMSLSMGELVSILLLLNNIMIRKCWLSWITLYLLLFIGFINLVYINTGLCQWWYDLNMPVLVSLTALVSAFIYLVRDNNEIS